MRCKMTLRSINEHGYKDSNGEVRKQADVLLEPVTSGSNENDSFWAATPSGKLELGVVNMAAVAGLEVGTEYYIDITPAG